MTDAPLGNLDFDDMLRYVESGHNSNKPGTSKILSPSKSGLPNLQHLFLPPTETPEFPCGDNFSLKRSVVNPIAPVVHDQSGAKNIDVSRMPQPKTQKRQSKKSRATYESDDDAQIAMRLARLRRDVLEQQEDVEEEVVNEHEHTDDALERLRSFRESLGIPEPHHRQHSTPKSKSASKRRYNSSDKSLGRKDFESPAEVSEAQLLYRLQKLRQSLTSPERSKSSKSQRVTKKKRIQYFSNNAAATTNTSMSAELFSAASENPSDASMLHMPGVNPGLAKELQQHWAMDLNNVMHMGFAIEGGQVDQFVGHGHLHQYAQ